MSELKRYIVTTTNKNFYITKFYINKIENVLRFSYDIYLIKNEGITSMIEVINQSFINNPESDNIFNKLSTEKKFAHSISQIEALDVLQKLNNLTQLGNVQQYFKVELPNATLYYEQSKVKLLYQFIKHFCENYELIKLQFETPKINNEQEIERPKQQVNTKEFSSNLFKEIIKLSPNNTITFFILKELTLQYTNQEVAFRLNDNILEISITKFSNNLMMLYNNLSILINFKPNIPEDSYKNSIKNRLFILIKLIITINENKDILNKNDLYFYINCIILLLYIYGIWLTDSNTLSNIYLFVNKLLASFNNQSSGNIKSIKFTPLELKENDNLNLINLKDINEIANKYRYLLELDRKRFISSIITDINNKKPTTELHNNFELIINTPKLLDISVNPLNYNIISDSSLSSHKIISAPYHSYLILKNSKNLFTIDNLDETLPKLFDIIDTAIIPSLNKHSEQIILNPSTLAIYKDCIEPNIKNNLLSLKEKFYILYDISIAYLYDRYNIIKFIDYFH